MNCSNSFDYKSDSKLLEIQLKVDLDSTSGATGEFLPDHTTQLFQDIEDSIQSRIQSIYFLKNESLWYKSKD